MKNKLIHLTMACLFCSQITYGASEVPQMMNLSGDLNDSYANPILDTNAVIRVQILSKDKTCVMYDEQQYVNTAATNGSFNISVGSAVGDIKRTAGFDPGSLMVDIYQNKKSIPCTGGSSYTPAVGDERYVRISVTKTGGTAEVLSPDILMGSMPTSLVAERAENLQGVDANGFVQIKDSVTQDNVKALTDSKVGILALLDGTSSVYSPFAKTADLPAPVDVSGKMDKSANLSDLLDKALARQNLGLGEYATRTSISTTDISGLSLAISSATSSKIDSSQMPANCSAGKTLTFVSPSGTWACSDISISASQVSDLAGVATSGSYTDLLNKPTGLSSFTNDAGYLTSVPAASTTQDGLVNQIAQSFAGVKTFVSQVIAQAGLIVTGDISATGTVQVGSGSSCASTDSGKLRYNIGNIEFCNGSTWIAVGVSAASTPSGAVIAFAGSSCPAGYVLADGKSYKQTTYASLYAAISSANGNGSGGVSGEAGCPAASGCFNVPDYRGRFLRGVDLSTGRDPDRAGRGSMAAGGNAGDAVGSVQGHAFQTHTHIQDAHNHAQNPHNHGTRNGLNSNNNAGAVFPAMANSENRASVATYDQTATNIQATATNQNASAYGSTAQASSNETRPVNAFVNYCVKY